MENVKKGMAIFPLDPDKRMVVSTFFAGAMTLGAPFYGPVDISNPVLTLAFFFLLQAIILAVLMKRESSSYTSSMLGEALTLGPLGILTGVALIVQSVTVDSESNEMFWIIVGAGFGLVIAGLMNVRHAALLLVEKMRIRAKVRRILDQQVQEARQGAMNSMAQLMETVKKIEEEDALLADFGSAIDGTDGTGEGRTNA